MEMLKCDTHQNKIAVYRFQDVVPFYKKVSFSSISNVIIENEFNGFKWYFEKVCKQDNVAKIIRKNFYEISVPEFIGTYLPSVATIGKNKTFINSIIDFYCNYWPQGDDFHIHGDLALSNVIFSKQPFIIDWEHFHKADQEYFGFDIINMLFIALWSESPKKFRFKRSSIEFIYSCRKRLFRNFPQIDLASQPFQRAKDYLINNAKKFNVRVDVGKKFALASCPDDLLKELDKK